MMGSVGISSSYASYSISIMAFSNMIGRIASGIVLDWSYINSFAFIFLSFVSSGKYFWFILVYMAMQLYRMISVTDK